MEFNSITFVDLSNFEGESKIDNGFKWVQKVAN